MDHQDHQVHPLDRKVHHKDLMEHIVKEDLVLTNLPMAHTVNIVDHMVHLPPIVIQPIL